MKYTVYLGLGTNLGERVANLEQALLGLQAVWEETAVSPIYETEPWGDTEQPTFLNLCAAGKTDLAPHELLRFLKQLEEEIGRTPTRRWGPRLIDIDILFYDDLVLESETLTIPHKFVAERPFVLVPLAAIAHDLIHPQIQATVAEMMAETDVDSVAIFKRET
ncbi:MAG: 2-amino-4-hydroxy-6-hydroxymethyldihydropteridine diphosphokinase [Chloroflexota bacterium]